MQAGMDSLVLLHRKDGVDDEHTVMIVSKLIVGVVKHPKGGAQPALEVWISVEKEAAIDWQAWLRFAPLSGPLFEPSLSFCGQLVLLLCRSLNPFGHILQQIFYSRRGGG